MKFIRVYTRVYCKYRFLSRIILQTEWCQFWNFLRVEIKKKSRDCELKGSNVRCANRTILSLLLEIFNILPLEICIPIPTTLFLFEANKETRRKSYINFSKSHYKKKISIGLIWLREKFFRHLNFSNFLGNYTFLLLFLIKITILKGILIKRDSFVKIIFWKDYSNDSKIRWIVQIHINNFEENIENKSTIRCMEARIRRKKSSRILR